MFDLSGKVALITGAARGQGRAHALKLAAAGADVVAIDVCAQIGSVDFPMSTPEDLEETRRLVESLGRRAVAEVGDVRDLARLEQIVATAVDELGSIDIVVANAGISSYAKTWELTPEQWQDMIDVNLTGVWNTLRATVPQMRAQRSGGSIIITSSTAAVKAIPNASHYSAAKAGIVALAKSLAQELGPEFIRVNTIHPTGVDTQMIHNEGTYRRFMPDRDDVSKDDVAPKFAALNVLPVPWMQPSEVSDSVLFLASDASKYITGSMLMIDAGATAKYPGS